MRSGNWAIWMALLWAVGCNSRPGAIRPPSLDPADAAEAAIELYDASDDGMLSKEEWSLSPELTAVVERYDTNSDASLTDEEIAEGIRGWQEGPVGVRAVLFRVSFAGRPLSGATVKLVPASFLGDAIKPATGEANQAGAGKLGVAPEDLPRNAPKMKLAQPGLYHVEITHPKIKIPEKYNTKSTLGVEISGAYPGVEGIVWNLTK